VGRIDFKAEAITMAALVIQDRAQAADMPLLAVEPHEGGAGWCVRACNLGLDLVVPLGRRVESLLRVTVADSGALDFDDGDVPDISGDHEILDDGVRFIPHLPFETAVPFRAILDLRELQQPGLTDVKTLEFSFPEETAASETKVSHVYPSNDILPENLLRFYVRFSNPMWRGRAEQNIEILGPDGRPAPDILYRTPVELWDCSMTCLTVLLDPGRLKRGVGPNRALGPPLRAGQRYTLAIGGGMIDAHGRRLREGFNKSFSVSEPVREPVGIKEWRIRPPVIDSRESLDLTFPRPLDWAQLWCGITVVSESRQAIDGQIDIDPGETRWRFTPDAPWQRGAHSVRVVPTVEDICGNTPCGPFDGTLRSAEEMGLETAVSSISFEVRVS
jgi:hypothetical protein